MLNNHKASLTKAMKAKY